MVRWLILLALLIATPCQAAVLVQSANGQYSGAYKTLAAAAVAPGVTNVVVTSALSAVQSNISSASLHAWPADRILRVEKGGSINPTTKFTGLKESTPEMFGAVGDGITDDTAAVNKALAAIMPTPYNTNYVTPGGGVIRFTSKAYKFGALTQITAPIIMEFNNSYVHPNTTGIVIDINYTNAVYNAEKLVIRDLNFGGGGNGPTPTDLIKVTDGYNVVLDNVNAWGVITSHSFFYNYHAAGLTIQNCILRGGVAPYAVYLEVLTTPLPDQSFSNAVTIDHLDVSAHTGVGIYSKAGNVVIRGMTTIEGCTGGGIIFEYGTNNSIITDSYFESNTGFAVKWSNMLYGGNYAIRSSSFGGGKDVGNNDQIQLSNPSLGGDIHLTIQDTHFYFGGVSGVAGTNAIYTGINNREFQSTQYYSGTYNAEVKDDIKATLRATYITKEGVFSDAKPSNTLVLYRDTEWIGATGATPPTGWSVGTAGTFTVDTGSTPLAPYSVAGSKALVVAHNGTNNNPNIRKTYTTVLNKSYRFSAYTYTSTPPTFIKLGSTSGGTEYASFAGTLFTVVKHEINFVASSTTTYVTLGITSSTLTQYGIFDEVFLEQLN